MAPLLLNTSYLYFTMISYEVANPVQL